MTFNKLCTAILLSSMLSFTHASVLKLADVLVSSVELKRKIVSSGVRGASVNTLGTYVTNSVESLMGSSRYRNLYLAVKNTRVDRSDNIRKTNLLRTLNKPSSQVSSEQFTRAVNDLVVLADRYGIGNDSMISCSVCLSEELSLLNFNSAMRRVGDQTVIKSLKRVPNNPSRLSNFIKSRARRLGVRDTFSYLQPQEQRVFGLFLEMGTRGSSEYKQFAKNVIKFNNVGNDAVLIGPQAPSQLWKILASNITEEKVTKWNKVLNASLKESEPAKRKQAFYDELIKLADGDSGKIERIKQLKSNNCFFK